MRERAREATVLCLESAVWDCLLLSQFFLEFSASLVLCSKMTVISTVAHLPEGWPWIPEEGHLRALASVFPDHRALAQCVSVADRWWREAERKCAYCWALQSYFPDTWASLCCVQDVCGVLNCVVAPPPGVPDPSRFDDLLSTFNTGVWLCDARVGEEAAGLDQMEEALRLLVAAQEGRPELPWASVAVAAAERTLENLIFSRQWRISSPMWRGVRAGDEEDALPEPEVVLLCAIWSCAISLTCFFNCRDFRTPLSRPPCGGRWRGKRESPPRYVVVNLRSATFSSRRCDLGICSFPLFSSPFAWSDGAHKEWRSRTPTPSTFVCCGE